MGVFIVIVICIIIAVIAGNNTQRFSRDDITNLYSSLLSDMNVDYGDMKMTPTNITNIKISLDNFTKRIEATSKQIHMLTEDDIRWLVELISEFRGALLLWIRRHESELRQYEREVENIAESSGSGVIRLAEKRLESQIKLLSRVR